MLSKISKILIQNISVSWNQFFRAIYKANIGLSNINIFLSTINLDQGFIQNIYFTFIQIFFLIYMKYEITLLFYNFIYTFKEYAIS